MRLCLGPVPPTSARAWIAWAEEGLRAVRGESTSAPALTPQVLDDIHSYVHSWADVTRTGANEFRWQAEVDPDELEYLTHALYNLDMTLAGEVGPHFNGSSAAERRAFHVVLVQALLFALDQQDPSRAAFAEGIRPFWQVVLEE